MRHGPQRCTVSATRLSHLCYSDCAPLRTFTVHKKILVYTFVYKNKNAHVKVRTTARYARKRAYTRKFKIFALTKTVNRDFPYLKSAHTLVYTHNQATVCRLHDLCTKGRTQNSTPQLGARERALQYEMCILLYGPSRLAARTGGLKRSSKLFKKLCD